MKTGQQQSLRMAPSVTYLVQIPIFEYLLIKSLKPNGFHHIGSKNFTGSMELIEPVLKRSFYNFGVTDLHDIHSHGSMY